HAAAAGVRRPDRAHDLLRGGADHRPAGLRRHGGAVEIPDARRGDRMTVPDLPLWAAILTAIFLVSGALITLIGSLGLLRLSSFYERVQAPTLGTTLGTGSILVASMICFSVLQSRPVVHEI